MTEEDMITWINNASLQSLLQRWRFEKIGSPWFLGKVGEHYQKVMFDKRNKNPEEWVRVSKIIGWR